VNKLLERLIEINFLSVATCYKALPTKEPNMNSQSEKVENKDKLNKITQVAFFHFFNLSIIG